MPGNVRLVMTQGPQPGQTFTLDKDVANVGREPTGEVVINSPQVSRQHARLTRRSGAMVLEDLGSTNGTFVNGMRLVAPHTLANGDVIGLGDAVTFTYYSSATGAEDTMVSPSATPPPAYTPTARLPDPTPLPVAPVAAFPSPPPPQPYYPPEPKKKSRTGLWIGCGCGLLIGLAVLIGVVWYMDAYYPDILYMPLQWLGLTP
jgi:hypothetical protein